jgi:hypothetical protein
MMTLGSPQPLTKMNTRSLSGDKVRLRLRLTTLPPSVSRLSRQNVGTSTSHNPMGLHGLLHGCMYVCMYVCIRGGPIGPCTATYSGLFVTGIAGGWVDSRAVLDAVEYRKISYPCRKSNPGRRTRSPSLYQLRHPNSNL